MTRNTPAKTINMKSTSFNGYLPMLSVGAAFLLFELISFLNGQWLSMEAVFPWPTDFIGDLQDGFYWPTAMSTLIASGVFGLGYLFYAGGFARIIAHATACFLLACLFFLILTSVIVNAWVGLHITTARHLWDVVTSLIPHTKTHHRFVFSALLGSSLPVLLFVNWLHERIRQDNKSLGDAHFATGLEVQRAGFFDKEHASIIIGKKYGVPLYANGFEHVLVFAPAGSGKTRSIAIPNLFNYPYSIVCNDVKLTLFETTSGFRERVLGHQCFCFAPARVGSVTHRYNPLSFISADRLTRMTDIQRIAHIFIPDNDKNPFWPQTSRDLFKALTLYLLDTPERPTTLGEINRLIKQANFDGWLKVMLDDTTHYDPEFYRNGYSYINTEQETRNNIRISFAGHFGLFDDPTIDAATSASDFDFGVLRRKKMTIYVGFTDEDMHRLSPLLTLFWQQLLSRMIQAIPDKKEEPYPLLCLVDEFSSLGRIESLRRSLKLFREYRVRCILMFQYIAQTYEKYSHDEARAFVNIKTKVAYTTEDIQDAEFISKMLGTRTQRVVTHAVSSQSQGMSDSKNTSYQAIPLLRPDEIMKLSPKLALIIRSGSAPIKAGQFIWYKERVMKNLLQDQSSVPTQTPKQVEFKHAEKAPKTSKEKKNHKTEKQPDNFVWTTSEEEVLS
jgi:type IV secretion system protein VirD4